MKHTIVRYTLAIIGLFSVTSCTDYLDNAPDDILTLDMVFNSKNRTEEWLAGIYDGIPDPYTPMMRNYDAYADDFSPSQDWRAFSDWDCIDKILGNWTPQSEWKGNFWSDFPVRIREAYIFLDNVKALPEQEVYQADVDNMKAEARFLIAYYYYLLVNTYGAIPFQTSLVDMNDPIDKILIGQTPYDQIIDWLDKEFKAVSELLPPSYTEERKYGRATSVMALAIRARMLLFAASPLVNGNDDPDYAAYTNNKGEAIFNSTYDPKKWERAVNACKDLLTLDRNERKMSLGIKQLTPDPWADIETRYPVGTKCKAKVRNFTNFGVFVEIEEGIDGLIHISDLSWTKKIKHPGEFTSVGAEIEVVVLEVDKENRRLSLGHKQLEENPWNEFEGQFAVDSVHEGTITEMTDKGAVVSLGENVEGFAPMRQLVKEDGTTATVGEKLPFKVIEFSKATKRITLSHTRLFEEAKRAERAEQAAEKKASAEATKSSMKKINASVEKTTLGDIAGLAELKDAMEAAAKEEK